MDQSVDTVAGSTFLQKIPYFILFAFLILLPIFIIPSPLVSMLFSKIALLNIAVVLSFLIGIFSVIKSGKVAAPSWRSLIVVAVVPIATIISAFLSPNKLVSSIGGGFELTTVYSVVICFLLLCLVAFAFNTKQKIFWSYIGFLAVFLLVSAFHIARFIGGVSFISFGGVFASVVSNTIGGWSDLGTYAGLAVVLSFITLEFVDLGKAFKMLFYIVMVLGLLLLGVTNFYAIFDVFGFSIPLTAIVGLISLFSFVYVLSQNYRSSKKIPTASLIVLVFCVVVSVAATPVANYLYTKIGISQNDVLEVRPTIYGTYNVTTQVVKSGVVPALFGVGPNRFFAAWGIYKPEGVNQTVFWNTDFAYGSGFIPTAATTTGVVGIVAWIFFLVSVIWAGTRAVFRTTKDSFSKYLILSSLLASLYLWLMCVLYVASPVIVVFAFFFTGLLGASLLREQILSTIEYSWTQSQKKGFVAIFALILLFIGGVVGAFRWSQYFVASMDVTKANTTLRSADDIAPAEALVASAITRVPQYDAYLRFYSQLKILELQVSIQKGGKMELNATTQPILGQAIFATEEAVRQNPTDYHNLIQLGQIYQTAGVLGVQTAAGAPTAGDAALRAYNQAALLIPGSPLPSYLIAQLFTLAQNPTQAKIELQKALQIKPDFQEAQTLFTQLEAKTTTPLKTTSANVQTTSSPAAKSTPTTKTASSTTEKK